MSSKCQFCGSIHEHAEHNDCTECTSFKSNNYLKVKEDDVSKSKLSFLKRSNIKNGIKYLKFFKKAKLL